MGRNVRPETIERKLEEALETDFSDEKAVLALIKQVSRATLNRKGAIPGLNEAYGTGEWLFKDEKGSDPTLRAILSIEDEKVRLALLEKYYAFAQRLSGAFEKIGEKYQKKSIAERGFFGKGSLATLWSHIRYLDGLLGLVRLYLGQNSLLMADVMMFSVISAFCFHFDEGTGYLTDERVNDLLNLLGNYPAPNRGDRRLENGHKIFLVPKIYLRLKREIPGRWAATAQAYIEELQREIGWNEERIKREKEEIKTLKGMIKEVELLLSPDS